MYLTRTLESTILSAVQDFPVVLLTGPRQSGKTTTLTRLLGSTYQYISLDTPDQRLITTNDPRGFLDACDSRVILDEVQNVPELLPYIRERVDSNRSTNGQFVLSGSQNLLLNQHVSESLAGRVAVLQLLPLSRREVEGQPNLSLPWQSEREGMETKRDSDQWATWIRGSYPEIVADQTQDPYLWFASYLQTYLERDVRTLRQVGTLTEFQMFIQILASRSGSLINYSDIARELGIAVNTVKAWISVLEATFQIFIVRPYFANIGKRLVKTPKIYFLDAGMLCHLTGLRNPEHARLGPLGGAIFETLVLTELIKTYTHQGLRPRIYFWRTSSGQEVDFIVEQGAKLIPIETKSSSTIQPKMGKSISMFQKDLGESTLAGYVVHPGNTHGFLAKNVRTMSYSML